MPYLRDRADRGKAMAMVAALHVALGAALLTGLAGGPVHEAVRSLRSPTIEPLTLEPQPPAPKAKTSAPAARDEAAPPDLLARPTPVVAPRPLLPLPARSPVNTSDERALAEGADRSAGAAAVAGPGTGAGGAGDGFGAGGAGGEGSGGRGGLASQARLLSGNLVRRDYSRLRGFGIPSGQAVLSLTVGPAGRLTGCTAIQGSGSPGLDGQLCSVLMARSRWASALDQSGRPVTVQLRYTATWSQY